MTIRWIILVLLLLVACTSETPTSTLPAPATVPASPAAAHALATATTIFEVYKIPNGYYDQPCQKPAHLTFYDWMATLEMPPYETDAFDCSQRSAYVEWLSENCGHRATIAGESFEGYGHLWVMIDIGGVPYAYEPGHWVPREGEGSTHFHYSPDTVFEDLYDTPWAHSNFEGEYAWWETYPELMEGGLDVPKL